MRILGINTATSIAAREPVAALQLLWITAKDRSTGTPQTFGFCDAAVGITTSINGASRDYYGAGGFMGNVVLKSKVGTSVQSQNISLSGLDPKILEAIRQYDARYAPFEIHIANFNTRTRVLLDEPFRVFKGFVNSLEIKYSEGDNPEVTIDLKLVSSARLLTRVLTARKSDEDQRLRSDDRFFRYAAISGNVSVYWGEASK